MSDQIVGKITMGAEERRDMFAAAALSGLLAGNRSVGDNSIEAIAQLAFQIADIMVTTDASDLSRKSKS
ncbi:MAG: hypothetical protein EOP83_24645 [Verrucomicrobiaceae bacterium]|nr:MAG: hypothetical protein EOP83_24645 [Verrucomicrobiaceae bacterium]